MALSRRTGQRFQASIWPGFVDAMTGLLLVLMFVLTIFMVVQFVLRETITGQESELDTALFRGRRRWPRRWGWRQRQQRRPRAAARRVERTLDATQRGWPSSRRLIATLTATRDRRRPS